MLVSSCKFVLQCFSFVYFQLPVSVLSNKPGLSRLWFPCSRLAFQYLGLVLKLSRQPSLACSELATFQLRVAILRDTRNYHIVYTNRAVSDFMRI